MKRILRHIRQSLALKLSLGIMLMTVPVFVIAMGIMFLQSRDNIKKEATERATAALSTSMRRMSRYLRTIETATNSNAWLVTERLHPDSLLECSRRVVLLNGNVDGCSITTEPDVFPQLGKYFSAYTVRQNDTIITVREGEYDYYSHIWYKKPAKEGKACWVDPFDDYNEGTLSAKGLITSYCKPVFDADGHLLGVISTDLSLQKLSEVIQEEKPYPHSYFMMLGEDGHYFIHPDTMRLIHETIFSMTDAQKHPEITALGHEMTAGHQGVMRVSLDGRPCLVCYQPIAGTQWSLALVCPESDMLQSLILLTKIIVPLTLIGMLLILIMTDRIVTKSIRPLNHLVQQSKRIAEGHYDETIPATLRHDAIGRLQNSFSAMQSSLERHFSDIRQMNAEAEHRNNELRDARMLAEEAGRQKTAFIQNMTHQIRTPLNIIMGFAQVLHDDLKALPEDEAGSITYMIHHNAMILNRMMLMLYDSSETGLAEELHSNRHDLTACNQTAREAITRTQERFRGLVIAFETSVADDLQIRTNRTYLMRSLLELLYNAVKYSDGKHVAVKVSKTDETVSFTIEDKGPGIPDDYLSLLFEPFTKINDLSEGLGLGLPLTKRHAVNLGGNLIYDSDYTEGCRFTFELPLTTD